MDTNPFAVSPNAQQSQQPLQMSPIGASTVTSAPGGVAAMVKAIMDGNNQYKQRQGQMPPAGGPGGPLGAMSGPPPGPPMSLAPTNPGPMAGGPMMQNLPFNPNAPQAPGPDMLHHPGQPQPPMQNMSGGMPTPDPFSQGAPPIPGLMPQQQGGDPVTQALFSPIPGM